MVGSRLAVIEQRLNKFDKFIKNYEEDRKMILDLIDKCSEVIGQTNEREDKHFEEMQVLSDRINLAEGMIDIFKQDISEIRDYVYDFEEDDDLNEYETSE